MRLALAACLLLAAAAPAVPAGAVEILRCDLGETRHGWVARSMVLAHEPGAAEAIVADDLGLFFTGKPSTARVTAESARRLRFTWSIPKVEDGHGNMVPAMIYRAALSRGGSDLRVWAEPLGYQVRFSGRGSCRPVPEAERRSMEALVRKGTG